jgi:PRTRC genetic system ThiF family protein
LSKTFHLPGSWLTDPIRVIIAGAGGTGGEVMDGLARMHAALLAVGHPHGFQVEIYDPDTVSQSNVGRQRFSPADVDYPKAILLAHRYNLFYGLKWRARPETFTIAPGGLRDTDILITCVDKASVRVSIGEKGKRKNDSDALWLDFGNGSHTGQVVLGHWSAKVSEDVPLRLPNVFDLYHGELRAVDDSEEPSCSAEEAFQRQDFGVNRLVADAGLGILWNLLRHGETRHHGSFVDLRSGTVSPLLVDPETWAFLGYTRPAGTDGSDGQDGDAGEDEQD